MPFRNSQHSLSELAFSEGIKWTFLFLIFFVKPLLLRPSTLGRVMKPDLHKFKELYKDAFGVELTDEQSEVKARVLMNLYKAVYGSPDLTLKMHEERRNA